MERGAPGKPSTSSTWLQGSMSAELGVVGSLPTTVHVTPVAFLEVLP
jgi:hypothetical protein